MVLSTRRSTKTSIFDHMNIMWSRPICMRSLLSLVARRSCQRMIWRVGARFVKFVFQTQISPCSTAPVNLLLSMKINISFGDEPVYWWLGMFYRFKWFWCICVRCCWSAATIILKSPLHWRYGPWIERWTTKQTWILAHKRPSEVR